MLSHAARSDHQPQDSQIDVPENMKLHGDLEVEVVSGEYLKDMDHLCALILKHDVADPSVEVRLGSTLLFTTSTKKDVINTVWREHVTLPVCETADCLNISVWDKDPTRMQFMGKGSMKLGRPDKEWEEKSAVRLEGNYGIINLRAKYTPAAQARMQSIEVPNAYFPMRQGGTMTFYQDAHTEKLPGFNTTMDGAFEDIADAISRAKKFIYITAWSFWHKTKLRRDDEMELGELLKLKASEGVRVLLLIWDEKFSKGKIFPGFVGTHDEKTARFFKKTDVHVAKVYREIESKCDVKKEIAETIWSHHQKVVVVDDGQGDLVAFCGGLDLTSGRWDTPDHEIFSTLDREHKGDFHNAFISVNANYGPREPWHDVHARLTGSAAIDLLRNFEERWRKQVPDKAHLLVRTTQEDLMREQGGKEINQGTVWQMQVVRSIDKDSTEFCSARAGMLNHVKEQVVDTSLYQAFVRLVRKAQNFIYIESQYFGGSSMEWSQEQDLDARNLLALEITQRVVEMIRAGQPFRVYVVVPMVPENSVEKLTSKGIIKAIMHYQFLTMQMMYKKIGEALREVGSDLHPTDYLLFLCLGKKESQKKVREALGGQQPRKWSEEWDWRQKSRFLIYVHSKMAVADDTHIILGTANLHERSLNGSRDSEIAVSARQVLLNGNNSEAEPVSDGEVAMFRRRLWAEHTAGLSEKENPLKDPSSLSAIRRIKELSDESWKCFMDGEPDEESRSRFLMYPLEVTKDGQVHPKHDMPEIPDFDLPAKGKKPAILPRVPLL